MLQRKWKTPMYVLNSELHLLSVIIDSNRSHKITGRMPELFQYLGKTRKEQTSKDHQLETKYYTIMTHIMEVEKGMRKKKSGFEV